MEDPRKTVDLSRSDELPYSGSSEEVPIFVLWLLFVVSLVAAALVLSPG